MRILLSFIATMFLVSVNAQNDTSAIAFKTKEYSFGKIKQGQPVSTEFSFENKSNKNLIIETAVAECGCTTPDYPKTPVLKGKSAAIKVTYNAESPGKFTKRVTVKFMNIAAPIILTIDGEVTP